MSYAAFRRAELIKLIEAETGTIFNHPIVRAGDGRFSSDDCRLGRDT